MTIYIYYTMYMMCMYIYLYIIIYYIYRYINMYIIILVYTHIHDPQTVCTHNYLQDVNVFGWMDGWMDGSIDWLGGLEQVVLQLPENSPIFLSSIVQLGFGAHVQRIIIFFPVFSGHRRGNLHQLTNSFS